MPRPRPSPHREAAASVVREKRAQEACAHVRKSGGGAAAGRAALKRRRSAADCGHPTRKPTAVHTPLQCIRVVEGGMVDSAAPRTLS